MTGHQALHPVFRKLPRAAKHRHDLDETCTEPIDDAVGADDHLADLRILALWNHAAGLRKQIQSFDRRDNPPSRELSVHRRILAMKARIDSTSRINSGDHVTGVTVRVAA